jgi:hypothetical protein
MARVFKRAAHDLRNTIATRGTLIAGREAAMKIRFETTIEDVIAFNRFHYANSPAWRRQVWTRASLAPALFIVLIAMLFVLNRRAFAVGDDPVPVIVSLLGCGVVVFGLCVGYVLLTRWRLNSALGNSTRKYLAEGSNRTVFGRRELELKDGRLIVTGELFQSSFDLRAIEKIVSNEDYTFVYIASVSAVIIPMNVHAEEEHREFVADLRDAWENRGIPKPRDDHAPRRAVDERIIEG